MRGNKYWKDGKRLGEAWLIGFYDDHIPNAGQYAIGLAKNMLEGEHCACRDGGNFLIEPDDSPMNLEGGKHYAKCTKCGQVTHL